MTAGPSSLPGATAQILALTDGLLQEVGRREHRFAWLRHPDAAADDWLVVDAYYPSNRLVVCCGCEAEERRLCEELVPQHGLYLLSVDPDDLPEDPAGAQRALRDRLQADGWTPRPAPRPVVAAAPTAPPRSRRTRSRSADAAASPRSATSSTRRAGHGAGAGVGMGLALIAIAIFEAYLGIVVVAFGSDDYVLGFGLLLDACTRVIGTISAAHDHDDEGTWGGLLIGSPVLVSRPPPTRIIAIAALSVIAVGIVLAAL